MGNNDLKEIHVGFSNFFRSASYVVKADYVRWTRYWSSWVLDILGWFSWILVGGDYVAYVVIGMTLSGWLSGLHLSPFRSLMRAYGEGSLDVYLGRPRGLEAFILGELMWNCMHRGLNTALLLAFGVFVLGVHPSTHLDVTALTLVCLMTVATMIGLSLIEASFIGIYEFRFAQTPTSFFVQVFVPLLSGVVIPVSLLPNWAQTISTVLPHTYIYEALRQVFILGANSSYPHIQHCIVTLGIFATILIPLGIALYKRGITKAEREGTLSIWT